jgi:hypothetical protein
VTRTKSACGSTTTSSRQAPLALPLCTIPAPFAWAASAPTHARARWQHAQPRAAVGADASAAQVHAAGTRLSHAPRGNHACTVAFDATWRCRSSSTCGTSCGRSTRTATRRARCCAARRARCIVARHVGFASVMGVAVRFGGLRRSASCAPSWPPTAGATRPRARAQREAHAAHAGSPRPRALPGTQGARHTRSTHSRLGLRRPVAQPCGSTTRGRRARRRPRTASGCVRRSSRLKAPARGSTHSTARVPGTPSGRSALPLPPCAAAAAKHRRPVRLRRWSTTGSSARARRRSRCASGSRRRFMPTRVRCSAHGSAQAAGPADLERRGAPRRAHGREGEGPHACAGACGCWSGRPERADGDGRSR